jgi:uncharacterized protein YbjT (DUF2867 family)
MNILITGATGMFGGGLVKALSQCDKSIKIKALVRDPRKAEELGFNSLSNVEVVAGDMNKPETLIHALHGANRVFLVSPMVDGLDKMEINVINAAKEQGVSHIFKIFGAVKHNEDYLSQLHLNSIEVLKASGLYWTLISPNSVMETSFSPLMDSIRETQEIYGCTGKHKIGFVALEDVLSVSCHLLANKNLTPNKEYLLTGPQAVDFYQVAEFFTQNLGKNIKYINQSEEDFEQLLIEYTGKTREELDIMIMCHLRAWNRDGADLTTTTVFDVTGRQPMSVGTWVNKHKKMFL